MYMGWKKKKEKKVLRWSEQRQRPVKPNGLIQRNIKLQKLVQFSDISFAPRPIKKKVSQSHSSHSLHKWIRFQRIVVVFKLWSHRDYIYGYLQKIIRSVFMMCVSSWRLFFKVNRSNLSVESVCFSMLKWSELMNHCRIPCWDISRKCSFYYFFLLFSLPTCVQVSRCGDVYNTNNPCCSVLLFFCIVLNVFPLKHVPCFVILVWLQYSRWVCTI